MAVRGDRLIAVGDEKDVRSIAGPDADVLDLASAFVLPGFHDAHLHLPEGAIELSGLDLTNVSSAEEAAARVQAEARALPPGSWVRGWGWDQTRWTRQEWPDRFLLDRVVRDHPVFLIRIDGHVAWVTGAALRDLGAARTASRSSGGPAIRDPATGVPSGVLLERDMEEARDRLPGPSEVV